MLNYSQNSNAVKSLSAVNFDYRMRLKEYDLNGVIKELERLFPQCVGESILTRMDLFGRDLKIMADAARIKEAFMNLIRNATDAMPSGGVLTLSTGQAQFEGVDLGGNRRVPSAYARLSIADTGMGMDERTRERIQEPFFTTKGDSGKGLGFTIASYVIQHHRGSIMVDSEPAKGTKVNVYLPLLTKEVFRTSPIPLPSSFVTGDSYKNFGYMNKSL